jgi:ADP-heptose:LPS heptosyltransferase
MIHDRTGITPIIVTGLCETELASRAVEASSGRAIAATPTLKGFYELARNAAFYVGGDTGPTHLAIAAGAPVVGIFGPTEWWRNGSPHPDDICVERTDITCRTDCHRRTCGNWICMDINPADVYSAVTQRLSLVSIQRTSRDISTASKDVRLS